MKKKRLKLREESIKNDQSRSNFPTKNHLSMINTMLIYEIISNIRIDIFV